MRKVVVLIIDNQPIFRSGVRRALAHQNGLDTLEILDCAPGIGGEEAKQMISENAPDVALLDVGSNVNDPSVSGLELSRNISCHFPATRVVALSANPDADEMAEVIASGAAAYLSKDSSTEQLLETIKRVSSGGYIAGGNQGDEPEADLRGPDKSPNIVPIETQEKVSAPQLTSREMRFLNLIAEDNPNRQIAAILGISEQEIKSYVNIILRKLNAGDKAHSVMLELCNNWISIQKDEELLQTGNKTATGMHSKSNGEAQRSSKSAKKSRRGSSTKS